MQNPGLKRTILTPILLGIFAAISQADQNVTNTTEMEDPCPNVFYSIVFTGIEFPLYTIVNGSEFQGELVDYISKATKQCCAKMQHNIYYKVKNVSRSDDIERDVRSSRVSADPTLFFPVFANKDEDKQFGRDFIGFYESPGLAVLQIGSDDTTDDYAKQLDALFKTWPIVAICILAAILAGLFLWILVS